MSFFRSEIMKYCQLLLTPDTAYDCLSKLGELECVSFKDMCPFLSVRNRRYFHDLTRCYNLLDYVQKLKEDLKEANIPSLILLEPPKTTDPRDILDLEATLDPMKHELGAIQSNIKKLRETQLELFEMQAVLERHLLTKDTGRHRVVSFSSHYDATNDRSLVIDFAYLSGVIPVSKLPKFEQMLWRVTWGNLIYKAEVVPTPFYEPKTG